MDEQRRKAGEVWATYYLLEAALPLVRCALTYTMPTIAEQHLWWGAVSEHEVNTGTDWNSEGPPFDDVLHALEYRIGRLCEQADEDILRLDGLTEAEEAEAQ